MALKRQSESVTAKKWTRKPRRKCQPPDRKGLPSPSALCDLAKTYLETQALLWPDLVATSCAGSQPARHC